VTLFRVLLWAASVIVFGCTRSTVSPPPANMVHTVAVLPPNNRTADPLLVAGASFLEEYALRTDRITVPDVLAAEARLQLGRRGFTVVPADVVDSATQGRAPGSPQAAAEIATRGKLDGIVLYIEIRRWEPDVSLRPTFVLVSLTASLVDPASGRVLWSADHPLSPLPTPGSVTAGSAYATAAQQVMKELLTPLGAERPPAS